MPAPPIPTSYAEFSDPRLAALYDELNPLGADSAFFCRLLAERDAREVIDFGCGTGLLTWELARRGHQMTGIEPATAMLDRARRRPAVPGGAKPIRWIEGSSEALAGLHADALLMTSHVAQFLHRDSVWRSFLRAAASSLAPGGWLIFDSRPPGPRMWRDWAAAPASHHVTESEGPVSTRVDLVGEHGDRVHYDIVYHIERTGERLVTHNALTFRSYERLVADLKEAGFAVSAVYGDWQGSVYRAGHHEMVFVASLGPIPRSRCGDQPWKST